MGGGGFCEGGWGEGAGGGGEVAGAAAAEGEFGGGVGGVGLVEGEGWWGGHGGCCCWRRRGCGACVAVVVWVGETALVRVAGEVFEDEGVAHGCGVCVWEVVVGLLV